jgi:hypothetical protein
MNAKGITVLDKVTIKDLKKTIRTQVKFKSLPSKEFNAIEKSVIEAIKDKPVGNPVVIKEATVVNNYSNN